MIVLDNTYHDYDKYLGDLSGQDILVHLNDPRRLMNEIRNWFSRIFLNRTFVGTDLIWHDFLSFNKIIQDQFKDSWIQEDIRKMQMSEYRKYAVEWIKKQKKEKRIQ